MGEHRIRRVMWRRDGRSTAQRQIEELRGAPVTGKAGSVATRIRLLAYWTSLDLDKHIGQLPINISLFRKDELAHALEAMKDPFGAGLCVSNLVAVAFEGERLGHLTVPQGRVGLATVSSVAIGGALLKAGIPMDSKFGGILQVRNHKPLRFTELIEYWGCSVDPAQIFVASKMTQVGEAASRGEGKVLASFCEFPAPCRAMVEATIGKLDKARLDGLIMIGETSKPLCGVAVGLNKVGMILQSGLNPAASAVETGIEVVNRAMSGVIDYGRLSSFWLVLVTAWTEGKVVQSMRYS